MFFAARFRILLPPSILHPSSSNSTLPRQACTSAAATAAGAGCPAPAPGGSWPAILVDLVRLVGVDEDVAVADRRARAWSTRTFWCQQCWPLMGSGCTGNVRFWCTPPSSQQMRCGIGVVALERLDAVDRAASATGRRRSSCRSTSAVDQRSPPWSLCQPPAAEVVRAGDDAGPDALGHPDLVDEVADLGVRPSADRRSSRRGAAASLGCSQSGLRVRDLVEPLGVAGARVDQRRQPEGRQQHHLARRRGRCSSSGRGSGCSPASRAPATSSP